MLKRLIEVALPLKEVSEQSAREKSKRQVHCPAQPDWLAQSQVAAYCAAEITPKPEAAAKINPNVRLMEYAIRLQLSLKERTDGD